MEAGPQSSVVPETAREALAAEASCQYFYAFSPVTKGFVQGGTSGTLDGQPYALTFTGTGT